MNHHDPIDLLTREYDKLTGEWLAAYARYGNAHTNLTHALTLLANSNPGSQSAHTQVVWVKQALSELQQIQEQMKVLLDRVDKAVG